MKTKKQYGLLPHTFPRKKREFVDNCDYVDQLKLEERDWLARFNQEYYRNNIKKNDPSALHNTDELRRSLYSRENSCNRDLYSVNKATECFIQNDIFQDEDGNSLSLIDNIADDSQNENLLIEKLDSYYSKQFSKGNK